MSAVVEIFFDFVSPYSYLGWKLLPALAARHGRTVVPRPALLGGLLAAHGTRGPAEVPARRAHVIKDLVRRADAFGIPITLPPAHPFNPLLALRAVSQPLEAETRARMIDALFDAVWRDGREIESEAGAARALGADAAHLAAAAGAAAKAALRATTEELVAAGGFGVPTFRADGEIFFGTDALPHLEAFLRGADAARSAHGLELQERWRTLPATAVRRQP